MIRARFILLNLCLISWGGVMLYFFFSSYLTSYLSEKFHPLLLIGGFLSLLISFINFITINKKTDSHQHHDQNPIVSVLIIILPILFSLNWTEHRIPDALLLKKSSRDPNPATLTFLKDIPAYTRETLKRTHTKTSDGYYKLNLIELFYSAGDIELEKVFTGMKFSVSGSIRDEPNRNTAGTRLRLFKLFMSCCAADMQAIPLSLEFGNTPLPSFKKKTVVNVKGVMKYESIDGKTYPILVVDFISPFIKKTPS